MVGISLLQRIPFNNFDIISVGIEWYIITTW